MTPSLTIDESTGLLTMCRDGRLYQIELWITAGKSVVTDPSIGKTPLVAAVETGFHSLVELIVRNEPRQEQRDRALAAAVKIKRLDLIEVLVQNVRRSKPSLWRTSL